MDKKFLKHCEWLKKLGFHFRPATEWRGEQPPRSKVDLPFFGDIYIGLTAHEWCNLMMSDGQFYLGGCCANSSVVQDDLTHAFRFHSGWMGAGDFMQVVQHLRSHDEEEDPPKDLGRAVSKMFKTLKDIDKKRASGKVMADPTALIKLAGFIVEPFYDPNKVTERDEKVKSKFEDAILSLSTGLRFLAHHDIIEAINSIEPKLREGVESQPMANRALLLAKVIPDLKAVNEEIAKLEPFVFEGVALVTKDEPNELTSNGSGICVFKERKEAENLLSRWAKSEELYEDKNNIHRKASDFFMIRPIVVTPESGLQFKDEVHEEISN